MNVVRSKLDDKDLYQPPNAPVFVDVPASAFVMIDGLGDPNTSADYQAAVTALYSYCYPVAITLKKVGRTDAKVGALEGLWWTDDDDAFDWANGERSSWRWTMMIRQPPSVPADLEAVARAKLTKKVGDALAGKVRIERFDEGRCAQVMHHGPYADEGPTIARLHSFVSDQGLHLRGRHHEIYLSNPRTTVPAKMRTVLRQPVAGFR